MTDELPEIFKQLPPQSAPPELRPRVLSAVERELARRKKPRWERAFELGVAACLALGVGLNAWQWRADVNSHERVYGSSIESAGDSRHGHVFAASDAEVDRFIHDRLAMLGPHRELQAPTSQQYERLLKELIGPGAG
jgi:hypothetical protein